MKTHTLFQANRRMDRVRLSDRRKSDRRIQTHHSPKHRYDFERSPIIVDDKGGVMTHVITYPYVVPIYCNYGKYDLNNLNQDYHITTTTTTTTTAPNNSPWDKIEDIQLPDSFDDNIHSVFSLKNYKQYVAEKEAELHDSDYKDGVLVTSNDKTNDDDIHGETVENEDDYKKKTRDYLKQTYFKTFFSSNN